MSSEGAPDGALVTGGSKGIGQAIATELARRGHRVVIAGRDLAAAEDAARDIEAATGSPAFAVQADIADRRAWMDKNMPSANKADANHIYGYAVAFLMAETLRRCRDELTRANLMKQAAGFQKFRVPLLLPGITVSTSPTDYYPIQAVQLQRFKGETWELFGEIMHAESS